MNTNPGKQNARIKGSKICATREIRSGEEIFIPYGRNFRINASKHVINEDRSGWMLFGNCFYRDMG